MRYRNSHGAATLSSAAVDGAAFGTTFAHLFLMTFNNLVPDGLSQESTYVPRVFGFRVHPTSRMRNGNATVSVQVSNDRRANANGVTIENVIAAEKAVSASKPAASAVGADGKGKKVKRGKPKSEDSGGSAKRKTKNGVDTESTLSQKTKRPKRP